MKINDTLKQRILRSVCLLLALMLTVPLIACADQGQDQNTTTEATTAAEGPATTVVDEVTEINDDIPAGTDLGQEELNILCGEDKTDFTFESDQLSGDTVEEEVYARNIAVEERLNVKLNWLATASDWTNKNDFTNKAYNDYSSDGIYDIIAGYSLTGAMMTVKCVLQDISAYPVINFDKPWWPSTLVETNTVGGKIYFVSGDIAPSMLYMMFAIFVNKDLYADTHPSAPIQSVYDMVLDGNWTIDEMIELCQGGWFDGNANGEHDIGDNFGFMVANPHVDAFYVSCDLKFLDTDSEGMIILSEDIRSEKTLDVLNKLNDFFRVDGNGYIASTETLSAVGESYEAGMSVLTLSSLNYAKNLSNVDFSYGILPVPKYNTEQSRYGTALSFEYSNYSIGAASKKGESSAIVIEALASASYKRITPVLYEVVMKGRYSDSSMDQMMFDVLRESVVFERGRSFAMQFDTKPFGMFRLALRDQTVPSWTSNVTNNWRVLQAYAASVNKSIAALE